MSISARQSPASPRRASDRGRRLELGSLCPAGCARRVACDWRERLLACLDETLDQAVLEATVNQGPAVDGVSRLRALTVDNLEMAIHHASCGKSVPSSRPRIVL